MTFSLNRLRKEQVHSPGLKNWNHRGTGNFLSFYPTSVLAGDIWRCDSIEGVTVNGIENNIVLYAGDYVLANIDSPGELIFANVINGNWEILRKNPVGFGTKTTNVNGGFLGESSIDDDYLYLCVAAGISESLPGAGDGTATWKKIHLLNTI